MRERKTLRLVFPTMLSVQTLASQEEVNYWAPSTVSVWFYIPNTITSLWSSSSWKQKQEISWEFTLRTQTPICSWDQTQRSRITKQNRFRGIQKKESLNPTLVFCKCFYSCVLRGVVLNDVFAWILTLDFYFRWRYRFFSKREVKEKPPHAACLRERSLHIMNCKTIGKTSWKPFLLSSSSTMFLGKSFVAFCSIQWHAFLKRKVYNYSFL